MPASRDVSPFKPGDRVVYSPDDRSYGLEAMHNGRLVRGTAYLVARIEGGAYVVVEGYSHPGAGLHWSNFRADETGAA